MGHHGQRPCSPDGGEVHLYTLTLYAPSGAPTSLGDTDDVSAGWTELTSALDGLIVDTAELSFTN